MHSDPAAVMNGIPTHGSQLVNSVYEFNKRGQTTPPGRFNADRIGFYTGMQLEEMAEKITAIAAGCVTERDKEMLATFAGVLDGWGHAFKRGEYQGAIVRSNREELLDADIDIAVVTVGAMQYQTAQFIEAMSNVLMANALKCPGGKAEHDHNGKIQKPPGWKKPNLAPFVDHHGEE